MSTVCLFEVVARTVGEVIAVVAASSVADCLALAREGLLGSGFCSYMGSTVAT